jgi:hypothetical protein
MMGDVLNALSTMSSLTSVYVNNNMFTGTLSFVPQLKSLQFLHAGNNRVCDLRINLNSGS